MAYLAYPAVAVATPVVVQGAAVSRYTGTAVVGDPTSSRQDLRHLRPTNGTISDVMVLKTAGGEVPFVNGRVWLLRYADGFKSWEGWTDAAGAYTAHGLETGVDYVAVGIDPTRQHKTTGAGPVVAL